MVEWGVGRYNSIKSLWFRLLQRVGGGGGGGKGTPIFYSYRFVSLTCQFAYLKKVAHLLHIIILPLGHFAILGQENAQNMTRYFTVEHGKNTDGKRRNKTAGLSDPNFVLFAKKLENGDGLTYNTRGHFAYCSSFLRRYGARKILRNSQNIRACYMLKHRIRCI